MASTATRIPELMIDRCAGREFDSGLCPFVSQTFDRFVSKLILLASDVETKCQQIVEGSLEVELELGSNRSSPPSTSCLYHYLAAFIARHCGTASSYHSSLGFAEHPRTLCRDLPRRRVPIARQPRLLPARSSRPLPSLLPLVLNIDPGNDSRMSISSPKSHRPWRVCEKSIGIA